MGRRCIRCGKLNYSSPELSFHRFPINVRRRAEWLRRLGFQDNIVLIKHAMVCSLHFNPEEFEVRSSGAKVLKNNAVPLLYVRDADVQHQSLNVSTLVQSSATATEKESSASGDAHLIDNPPPMMRTETLDAPIPSTSHAEEHSRHALPQRWEPAALEKPKRFKCDQYSHITESKSYMRQHMLRKHTPSKQITLLKFVPIAKRPPRTILNNLRFSCHLHSPEEYQCGKCEFHYDLKVLLTRHFNAFHKGEQTGQYYVNPKLRYCKNCDFSTHSLLVLLRHTCSHIAKLRNAANSKGASTQTQKLDEQRKRNAAYSKAYRERKKRLREEALLTQIQISDELKLRNAANSKGTLTKRQKSDEQRKRDAAYSKAYRERKKRLGELGTLTQTQMQKTDEQRRRNAANSKAYRERKKRLREEGALAQESSVLQSQREISFETVALIHEARTPDPNENEQIVQWTKIDKPGKSRK